jgi:uncharacterized protein
VSGMCSLLTHAVESDVAGVNPLVQPWLYAPLPLGMLAPAGWLRTQLEIQADGLSGHLSLFYPDIENSSWIGGTQDGSGIYHERTPYW